MSVRHLPRACVALLALGLPTAALADVDITVSMSAPSQNVVPGGSGYVLDFSMTTTSAIDLGGFNVTVTVPSASGITFTGGDSSVANYVLAGNSLGPFFSNPIGPNSGSITDFPNTIDQPLAAGTYGLGEMFFSVASNAPGGSVNVTLDPATSFTQGVSPFGSYTYAPPGGSTIGTINTMVSSVPEPSSALAVAVCVAAGGLVWLGKRLRGRLMA